MKLLKLSFALILLTLGILAELAKNAGRSSKAKTNVKPSHGNDQPCPTKNTNAPPDYEQKHTTHGNFPPINTRPEIAQVHSKDHSCHSEQNKKHWLDYATFLALVAAALFALTAAIFTAWQAWIAQDTEKRQLRAYLTMSAAPGGAKNVLVGEIGRVIGKLDNLGVTPAYKVTWTSTVTLHRPDMELGIITDCAQIMSQADAAQWTIAKDPVFPEKDRATPFTAQEIKDLEARNIVLYFRGRICYVDIFEEVQPLDFCLYWDWDNKRQMIYSLAKYCRLGNGPPDKERDEYYRSLTKGVK